MPRVKPQGTELPGGRRARGSLDQTAVERRCKEGGGNRGSAVSQNRGWRSWRGEHGHQTERQLRKHAENKQIIGDPGEERCGGVKGESRLWWA